MRPSLGTRQQAAWFWLHWGQYASAVTNKDIEEPTGVVQLFYNNPGVQLVWNNSPFAKPALENDFANFALKESLLRKIPTTGTHGI